MRWIMGVLGLAVLVGADECGPGSSADTVDSGMDSGYWGFSDAYVELWSLKISDNPGDSTYEYVFSDNFTEWTWGWEDDTTGDYTVESDSGSNDIDPALAHIFHDADGNVSLRYFPYAFDTTDDAGDVPIPQYFEDYIGTVTINDDGTETWTFVCTFTEYDYDTLTVTVNDDGSVAYFETSRNERITTMTITMTVDGHSATGTYQETTVSTDTCEQSDEWDDTADNTSDDEDTDDYCLSNTYAATGGPGYMLDADGLGWDDNHNVSDEDNCDGDTCTLSYSETRTRPADTFTATRLATEYPGSTGYNEPFDAYDVDVDTP